VTFQKIKSENGEMAYISRSCDLPKKEILMAYISEKLPKKEI
jgi:hypothetical protein